MWARGSPDFLQVLSSPVHKESHNNYNHNHHNNINGGDNNNKNPDSTQSLPLLRFFSPHFMAPSLMIHAHGHVGSESAEEKAGESPQWILNTASPRL